MLRWHSSLYSFHLSTTLSVIWAEGPCRHQGASPTLCVLPAGATILCQAVTPAWGQPQANMPCHAILCHAMSCGWQGRQKGASAAVPYAMVRGCSGMEWIGGTPAWVEG